MAKVLIAGYGNPLRGDDGFGWHVAKHLERGTAGGAIEVVALHQLTPELAEAVSRACRVIFVDAAAQGAPGTVERRRIEPSGTAGPSSHHATPANLLAAARDLYGRCPEALLYSAAGEDFTHREELSAPARRALETVLAEIETGICSSAGPPGRRQRGEDMIEGEIAHTLREHPFVAGFQPDHIEKLAAMASEVRFAGNEMIFHQGDESSFFYLLVSGTVALEVPTPGRTLRIETLGPGQELGWSSAQRGTAKQFQARSLEEVHAVAFDGARLRHACEEDYAFGFAFMKALAAVMAERLQATRLQLLDLYSPLAAHR